MLPGTLSRVEKHSSPSVNEEIRARTERNIQRYKESGSESIARRIEELDREWDIERVLETNAASISLIGLGLGAFVDRRWLALPAVVAGFLLQHALQGWCPLSPSSASSASGRPPRSSTRGIRCAPRVETSTT